MKRYTCAILAACLLVIGVASAQDSDSSTGQTIQTKFIGSGSFEAGEFRQAEVLGVTQVQNLWYERAYMQIGFNASISERAKLFFVGEGMVHYNSMTSKDFIENDVPQFRYYPKHMEAQYSFGNIEKPFLQMGFGIFPYNYNNDIKDFGNYLFRTLTYPPIMVNQFDYTEIPLTGFRLSSTLFDSLNLRAMLTTESQTMQLQDFNVIVLADYTLFKAITIGAGVDFSRLLSVNENGTTPKVVSNRYIDSTGDTTFYSFGGTKLMGRLTIDPKAFFSSHIFGENDLRLYSEIAVIGIKNYPVYYKDLWRRIPIMVGFNIPAFKVLDVLSAEVEYYRWNYPNSYTYSFFHNQIPLPDGDQPDYNSDQQSLRWSLYAKRNIGKYFSVVGQVAFDHSRIETNHESSGTVYYGDGMSKHGDWAWTLKTQFNY